MNKEEWKTVIEGQIKFDHDYIPSFQTTIQILSEMLEERDRVYSLYIESGAQPVVNFTSDRGAINLKQNPLLRTWQEINTLCLSYLRDLGLTAAGLRKLQGQIPKEKLETMSILDDLRTKYNLDKYTIPRADIEPEKKKKTTSKTATTSTKKTNGKK